MRSRLVPVGRSLSPPLRSMEKGRGDIDIASTPRVSSASRRVRHSDGGGPAAEDRPRRSSFVTVDFVEEARLCLPSPLAVSPPARVSITHLLALVSLSSRLPSARQSLWEPHVCRICLAGDDEEELLPLSCRCKGDLGTVHALCATRWFVEDRGASPKSRSTRFYVSLFTQALAAARSAPPGPGKPRPTCRRRASPSAPSGHRAPARWRRRAELWPSSLLPRPHSSLGCTFTACCW